MGITGVERRRVQLAAREKPKFVERDILFRWTLASRDRSFDTGQEIPTLAFGDNVTNTCVTSSLFETV
jgi:hypothetical protein